MILLVLKAGVVGLEAETLPNVYRAVFELLCFRIRVGAKFVISLNFEVSFSGGSSKLTFFKLLSRALLCFGFLTTSS